MKNIHIQIFTCFFISTLCFQSIVYSQDWSRSAGGPEGDIGRCISIDANGNCYITGYFSGTTTFGTIQLTSAGSADIFIAKYDVNGNCIWAKSAGGIYVDVGFGISTDANGNCYITGKFRGTATFGTIQLTSTGSTDYEDIFIAKYDVNGNCLWAKSAGGAVSDIASGISTDANGNSYVTGSFKGTATFGTTQLTSAGSDDIFIAKYDVYGNCLWANKAGGTEYDGGAAISSDENGNCYVTGIFYGTATFGTTQLTSSGSPNFSDIFIAKYDFNGNCLWATSAGGTDYDFGFGISIDANGNCYVTGSFIGTATFGTTQLTSVGADDIFIAKYDVNGNCLWAKSVGGTEYDYGYSTSLDANGNCYVTGIFQGAATFGTKQLTSAGIIDIFITKYDVNGNCLWAKSAGGTDNDFGYYISADANGNCYVIGAFKETAIFGTTNLTSAGDYDIFVAKYGASEINDVERNENKQIPETVLLFQNYPNPFNPNTTISYSLPKATKVELKVYNLLGQEIATLANEEKSPGNYEVNFNAANLSSGVYIYKLQAEEFVQTRKMLLLN